MAQKAGKHRCSPSIPARPFAIEPSTLGTLYVGTLAGGVFKSTDGASTWSDVNAGLTDTSVNALAIDPSTPGTLYAGTDSGGVFSIQQAAGCIGDCGGTGTVAINDLIALVNVALGNAQPSACANGVPNGSEVNIALLIQAVNNALNGCG